MLLRAIILGWFFWASLALAQSTSGGEPLELEETDNTDEVIEVMTNPNDANLLPIQKILEPANTTSPRDTLQSFIKLTQRRYNHYKLDEITPDAHAERAHLFSQFEKFFDLTEVPKSIQRKKAVESAVFLREILDRTGIPPMDEVPDQADMLKAIKNGGPPEWTIPNTPIEIEYIEDGPDAGHFIFSSDTVAALESLYHQ